MCHWFSFEGKTKNRQTLSRHRAEQLLHHQPGYAVLLPGVQSNNALPVIRHLRQAEMAAEIHQIENVLLETAATEARAGIEEFRADPTVGADRPGHLAHVRPAGLTERRDRIDRTDPLSQKGISGEFGELAAPKVGSQNLP